jgi:hypothetical protein
MLYGPLKWVFTKIFAWSIVWTLSTVVLPGYVLFYEPFSRSHLYVPKSQHGMMRLKAYEYCGYLKTWIKRGLKRLETSISNLNSRTSRQRRDTKKWSRILFGSRPRPRKRLNIVRSMCIILAMHAASGQPDKRLPFDTDSKPLKVDNCTTASITPCLADCVTTPIKVRNKVEGIGGSISEVYKTTIKWSFEDNDGLSHDILLPGSYYVPTAPSRLLSPQHWAQIAKDNYPLPRGTWCATYDDCIELQWNQRKYTLTIPLDVGQTNVGTIHTTPGFSNFEAFCAECEVDDDEPEPVSFDTSLFTDSTNSDEGGDARARMARPRDSPAKRVSSHNRFRSQRSR